MLNLAERVGGQFTTFRSGKAVSYWIMNPHHDQYLWRQAKKQLQLLW
jgi:hypothetical protein